MNIGIIGFGRFGQFIGRHLVDAGHNVYAYDRCDKIIEASNINATFCPSMVDVVDSARLLILAMPIRELETTINGLMRFTSGRSIMDVASVKMLPCQWLQRLGAKNHVIGTHPLFGPQSGKRGISDLNMVITDIFADDVFTAVNLVKQVFHSGLGCNIIEISAEEHDRQMARSQVITHFIGRAAERAGIERVEASTKSFDDLMDIMYLVRGGSWELFEDMIRFNPFAKSEIEHFLKHTTSLFNEISEIQNATY